MIKKIVTLFSLAIMLTAFANEFSIHMVYAESFSDLHNQDKPIQVEQAAIQTTQLTAEPEVPNLKDKLVSKLTAEPKIPNLLIHLNNEMKRVSETIQENSKAIPETVNEVVSIIGNEYISTVTTAGSKYIGNSVYVFGGGRNANDIARGRFDCSGFVHWAFAQADIEIGSHTDSIKKGGRQVSPQEMQPGDLVFFDTYKRDGHVGIYLGDGKFIGSQSSTGVAIADMTKGYWKNAFKGRVIRI